MDKRELEQGLTKVAQILNSPEKDKIINEINKTIQIVRIITIINIIIFYYIKMN